MLVACGGAKEEETEVQEETISWQGVVDGKGSNFKAVGNKVDVVADMKDSIWSYNKQSDVFPEMVTRNNPGEVLLGSVTITDGGGMTYTVVYDMLPYYEESGPEHILFYSKSRRQAFVQANGVFLTMASFTIDGDYVRWSFTLPEGYSINKNYKVTSVTDDGQFYNAFH